MSIAETNLVTGLETQKADRSPVLRPWRRPGPAYAHLGGEAIQIQGGGLDGQVFQLRIETGAQAARVQLLDAGQLIGHCEFEVQSGGKSIALWYVAVEPAWQGNGLAALMVRAGLRRMVERYQSARFSIRMVQLIKTTAGSSSLQNLGMGILARQFGFEPDYDLPQLLRQEHVQGIELIEGGPGEYGYRILLNCYPSVLVAVQLDPETGEPYRRDTMLQYCGVTPGIVEGWATDPNVIFGNGDYVLRRRGVSRMIDAITDTVDEALDFVRRIKPAA